MSDSATPESSATTSTLARKGAREKPPAELMPAEVADYLQQNPDFFMEQDELLMSLSLPHQRGSAISLYERQLALLRDRNDDLKQRLNRLVRVANDNDRLFDNSRRLVLALIESNDLEQVTETLRDGLENDFGVEFHALILFNKQPVDSPVRTANPDVANSVLGELLVSLNGGQKVACGRMAEKELEFLFPNDHPAIGSVALSPLNFPDSVGVLALGSRDENHFRAAMGNLFLGYLSDVLCRVLSRFL
ncbi:DUF484 family protein [Endozoicomonas euniceicola]|uniref:DUF484 family protein n=1 Tax=Endozoicomonas euniceicola TaxID=1234143 RepID=A0ABY6H125_9GAMM|nr:DUF484 family protein [Endozoicomonas euniceicola]UYM18762.1 DUF484 family protein [Endozoicomonas euniceicola]